MRYRIGVDIGGMSVKLGAVDEDFNVVEKRKIPTVGRSSDDIINDIIAECKSLAEAHPVDAVGIGSAGRIDAPGGRVIRAGNLPFADEPIAAKISAATGFETRLDNDGNCAIIGEHASGACKGMDDAIIITIGTGIGGAMLLNGRVYRGHNGYAGELGHFIIDMNGRKCECGLHGCFEHYASARALIEMTRERVANHPSSILALLSKNGIDGRTAFDAKRQGCPVAEDLLSEYGRILAMGINSLTKIFQPELTVLSGGIANEGTALLDLILPWQIPDANVLTTYLAGDGGLIGAALLGTEYSL